MGWRNRVLSSLAAARERLDAATASARTSHEGGNGPDAARIATQSVLAWLELQGAVGEVWESCDTAPAVVARMIFPAAVDVVRVLHESLVSERGRLDPTTVDVGDAHIALEKALENFKSRGSL